MEKVKKQYGLWTGIAMVIGIVIGSGVFIKAGGVLELSGGSLPVSLLAWLVGGIIMISSGFCFAVFASRITKYNGVVDYVEQATNKKVGYGLAWLMTTFYYPIIASIVALFASSYLFLIIENSNDMTGKLVFEYLGDYRVYIVAILIVIGLVVLNYLSPMISAKFQVSTTVIKLIPIVGIALAVIIIAIVKGDGTMFIDAFTKPATTNADSKALVLNFGDAVKKTAFAYEGWVCATAINAELKNSKKNLPRALVFGTIAVLAFYIIYYISLSVFLGNQNNVNYGFKAPIYAFTQMLGNVGGVIIGIFIMISCLGTVNGVVISCCRGMYTMSCRGQGIMPEKFSKLGKNQSVSLLSWLYGVGCILLMFLVWYLANTGVSVFAYLGSMDEIMCAIIYVLYIAMYIYIIKNFKDCNVFQRYIMPIIAIIGAVFFVLCGTGIYQLIFNNDTSSLIAFGVFMVLFAILMLPCIFFYRKDVEQKELQEVVD